MLLVDHGKQRNLSSHALHAFITRDGTPPPEFLKLAREDALRYPTVTWRRGLVTDARAVEHGFQVDLDGGGRVTAAKLLLATGVVDELPELPGRGRF